MIKHIIERHKQNLEWLMVQWGIPRTDIESKLDDSIHVKRVVISAKKDGYQFQIQLLVQFHEAAQGYSQNIHHSMMVGVIPETNVDNYSWKISFFTITNNPHNLSLTIKKEHLGNKIEKLFGKRDLEVYEDEFDKRFHISSNHDYAYVDLLDKSTQELLLKTTKSFKSIDVVRHQIRYQEDYNYNQWRNISPRFLNLWNIQLQLAKNIQEWKPPIST